MNLYTYVRKLLVISALTVGCTVAHATTLVQTSFEGIVTGNNPAAGTPAIGSSIFGNFVIDTDVLTGEGPNCASTPLCWSGPDTSWNWNGVTITDSVSIPALFLVSFEDTDVSPGSGSDVRIVHLGGYSLNTVTLTLTDPSGSAFEGGGDFGLFASRQFSFVPFCATGIGCALNPFYSGDLTSMTSEVVTPEPATGLIVPAFAGVILLAKYRRRRRNA